MSTPPLNPLVTKIRTKYPGAYDDMDDATLTKSVLKKYPQYSDLAAPPMPAAPNMIQKQEINNPASPNFKGGNVIPGSFEGSYSSGDTGQAAAMSAAGGVAGAGLIAGPAARFATAHPILTMAGLEAAKQVPGVVGRVASKVPSWLPLLAGLGKGGGAVAAEEGAAATEAEAAAGTRVAAGKLPRETGAPYTGRSVPEMENVQSSNIRKAGYDSAKQRMWVEFKNGRVYTHDGVPPEIYKNFQDSESAGSFHAQNIKGRYDTTYRGSVLGRK